MPPSFYAHAMRFSFALIATAGSLLSCNSKQGSPETIPLPESLAESVEKDGTRFQALAYLNPQQARAHFGFDIRNAGLLPVQLSIDNHNGAAVKIIPRQTFLIDLEEQAWPLITSYQAFNRLESHGIHLQEASGIPALDDLESLTGFALEVTTSDGFSANTDIQPEPHIGKVLNEKNLRNPRIPAGKVASSVLFFPSQEEAGSARSLRLHYEQEGRLKFLDLPLKASPPLTKDLR